MTRNEWKRSYGAARLAVNAIQRPKGVSDEAWGDAWPIFWYGVYQRLPRETRQAIVDVPSRGRVWQKHWAPVNKAAIACNMTYLRNSYPHKGKSI